MKFDNFMIWPWDEWPGTRKALIAYRAVAQVIPNKTWNVEIDIKPSKVLSSHYIGSCGIL